MFLCALRPVHTGNVSQQQPNGRRKFDTVERLKIRSTLSLETATICGSNFRLVERIVVDLLRRRVVGVDGSLCLVVFEAVHDSGRPTLEVCMGMRIIGIPWSREIPIAMGMGWKWDMNIVRISIYTI